MCFKCGNIDVLSLGAMEACYRCSDMELWSIAYALQVWQHGGMELWRYGGMELWRRTVALATQWVWRYAALEARCGCSDTDVWRHRALEERSRCSDMEVWRCAAL